MDELLPATGMDYPQAGSGYSHTAMAGALYYDHRNPVSYEQVSFQPMGRPQDIYWGMVQTILDEEKWF